MTVTPLTIYLAAPRGFCAGVDRAIDIVEQALKLYGAPIYVRHEIVHNRWVVEDLRAKGVIFVKEVDHIILLNLQNPVRDPTLDEASCEIRGVYLSWYPGLRLPQILFTEGDI